MQKTGKPVYTSTALRRVVYALSLIVIVMIVGVIGFHYIEEMNKVNALYFESMLATGQGPPPTLIRRRSSHRSWRSFQSARS